MKELGLGLGYGLQYGLGLGIEDKKSYTRSDLLVKMIAYPLYSNSKCHIII